MNRTLILLKPDAVQRGLVGELIMRIERKGLKLAAMKLMSVTEDLAQQHYAEHIGKPFFDGLVAFITSSPVVALVVEGENAVLTMRNTLMGATNPQEAATGTIRGDYGMPLGMNLIHGSDSAESAEREIDIFFCAEEILNYQRVLDSWIIES